MQDAPRILVPRRAIILPAGVDPPAPPKSKTTVLGRIRSAVGASGELTGAEIQAVAEASRPANHDSRRLARQARKRKVRRLKRELSRIDRALKDGGVVILEGRRDD